jgi:integrase
LIEFCLRLNLRSRAKPARLTDRTGVPEWQRIREESFGGTGSASPANVSTSRQNRHRAPSRKRPNGDRLREKAAPKSINEEVRFLLKMLGDPGEVIRAHLKETKQLKLTVHKNIGKAFDSEETEGLATKAKSSRSPHMYPAFMLARNGGLRDTEIKTLTWGQINLVAKTVQVGRAKSEAGEGRIVPLNSEVYQALVDHRAWYRKRFGEIKDEWYVFPWGKPRPSDPTRHITSFKTAWKTTRTNAKVKGRWHDNRHSLITELAESGAGDETIMAIAGHVDRQMLRHYSHIRMKAKREALESVVASRRGRGSTLKENAPA